MILAAASHGSSGITFWLQVVLAGIATGCIYSLAGMGVVLTYKATGVFNFAHGAVAMIAPTPSGSWPANGMSRW